MAIENFDTIRVRHTISFYSDVGIDAYLKENNEPMTSTEIEDFEKSLDLQSVLDMVDNSENLKHVVRVTFYNKKEDNAGQPKD